MYMYEDSHMHLFVYVIPNCRYGRFGDKFGHRPWDWNNRGEYYPSDSSLCTYS